VQDKILTILRIFFTFLSIKMIVKEFFLVSPGKSYRKFIRRKFVAYKFLGQICGIPAKYPWHPKKIGCSYNYDVEGPFFTKVLLVAVTKRYAVPHSAPCDEEWTAHELWGAVEFSCSNSNSELAGKLAGRFC